MILPYKRQPMNTSQRQRNATQRALTETLTKLRTKSSRAKAERLAIADANDFQFTTAQIQRDIQELRRLGSLDALIVHHINKQKDSGLNEPRVHLSDDEHFPKILEKAPLSTPIQLS